MVGDSKDDTQAGRNAGAQTVLLVSDANEHLIDHEHTDIYVKRYVFGQEQLAYSVIVY